MPQNTRIPAAAAGGGTGEFFPIDGNVSVMLPAEDQNGVFGCTDDTAPIAYGMLALRSMYKFNLDSIQVYRKHGIRPEWWKTALVYCAKEHMRLRGVNCPVLENPDKIPDPAQVGLPAWARWRALTRRCPVQLPEEMQAKSNIVVSLLNSLEPHKESSAIKVFKMLQDIFDQPGDEKPKYAPQPTGSGEPPPETRDFFNFVARRVYNAHTNRWGELHFEYPPLTVGIRSAINALRPKPGFCGAFRYPQRAILPVMDGRAFGQRQRCAGGTVLVDGSGSMHISGEEIGEMIDQRPALTVAMYQGSGKEGMLYVLARNGKRVKDIPYYGGCNVVDGPALQWLAKQRKPRVWISDEKVTGICDKGAFNLSLDAEIIVRRNGIRKFRDLDSYLTAASIR